LAQATTEGDLVARVRQVNPDLENQIPIYFCLLSLPTEQYAIPKDLRGEPLRLALQEALVALLVASSLRSPVVLFLEDWHWVDEASHAALMQLIDAVAEQRLLIIVTSRPGLAADWGHREAHVPIVLRSLPAQSSLAMLASVLGADDVPSELADWICERAGGNPFFLEQVAQRLIEGGAVRWKTDERSSPVRWNR
jgi:predicted ATPase